MAHALRSRLRQDEMPRAEVQCLSDVYYGCPHRAGLPKQLDRYCEVLASAIKEPVLALALSRRALKGGCSLPQGSRRVCHIMRIRQRFRGMQGQHRFNTVPILMDEGVCLSLATLARVSSRQPPPYPHGLVAAAVSNIIDGVIYFEGNVGECYARAVRRPGLIYAWIHELPKQEMLAKLNGMYKDLQELIAVIESLGIPTLRLPWESSVDERVTLVEDWLFRHQATSRHKE